MLKKYYTFSAYSMDEITCFSTQEIFYRLLCEKVIEKRATAIAKLAETMEPMDYLIFDNDGVTRITIRCWKYEND